MKVKLLSTLSAAALMCAVIGPDAIAARPTPGRLIGVNVLLNQDVTQAVLADIARFGKVRDVISELDALTLLASEGDLAAIRALPYVAAANPDAVRDGGPFDSVAAVDFADGLNTWDMDAVDVTDWPGFDNRQVAETGAGVYVAVLDTGLVDTWRQYFPQERIASQYGVAFGGGGGDVGTVSSQPNKWEHDQSSHGTHVTSSILGYALGANPVNGVAPLATVIPVKVLNQNGSGWSSVIARGITYVANLKAGDLAGHPVVINMSLGGPVLDAVEKAAIDYAIEQGVIIVASAGNRGQAGMGYPGAYAPVISVAASGFVGAWSVPSSWWYTLDVPEDDTDAFYMAAFSSVQKSGQELDVAAPGDWIVGPYQVNSGQTSYYFLSGTSMASPHVAGIAALLAEKDPSLTQSEVEALLKGTATALPPGCREVFEPWGETVQVCWGADATGAGLVSAQDALTLVK